jgi:hypothetical protein
LTGESREKGLDSPNMSGNDKKKDYRNNREEGTGY